MPKMKLPKCKGHQLGLKQLNQSFLRDKAFFKNSNIIRMYSVLGDYLCLKNHTYRYIGEYSIKTI